MIINQYQNYMYNSKLLEEKFIKNSNNNFTLLKDNLFFRNITFQNFQIFQNFQNFQSVKKMTTALRPISDLCYWFGGSAARGNHIRTKEIGSSQDFDSLAQSGSSQDFDSLAQ